MTREQKTQNQNATPSIPLKSHHSMQATELIKHFIAKRSEVDLNRVLDFTLDSLGAWTTCAITVQENLDEFSKRNHSHYILGNI